MVDKFFNSIEKVATAPIDIVGNHIIKPVYGEVKGVVNTVYDDARSVVSTVGNIGKGVVDSGKGLVDGIADLFKGLGDLLNPNTVILIIGGVVVISLINKSGK